MTTAALSCLGVRVGRHHDYYRGPYGTVLRSASIPPVMYLAFQAWTDCRDTPYRTATSLTGELSNTSSTARYRCSTNHSRSPDSPLTAAASTLHDSPTLCQVSPEYDP